MGKDSLRIHLRCWRTQLLRGNTSSIHLSGDIISTASGSWERSLLKQPGRWTLSGGSPTTNTTCGLQQEGATGEGEEPKSPPANSQLEMATGWCHSRAFFWWGRSKRSLVGPSAQQELRNHAGGGFGPLQFFCVSCREVVGQLQHKLSVLCAHSSGNPLTFQMPDLCNPLRRQTKGGILSTN